MSIFIQKFYWVWRISALYLFFGTGVIFSQVSTQLDFTDFDQCETNLPQTPLFLGGLSFGESQAGDLQLGTYSFIVEAPSNFEIQSSGIFMAGSDIGSASINNIDPSRLEITLTIDGVNSLDQFIIENLTIENTSGASSTDATIKFLETTSNNNINGLTNGQVIASLSFNALVGGEALSQNLCRRQELQSIIVINDNIVQNRTFEWQELTNGVWQTIPDSDSETLQLDTATFSAGTSTFRRATTTITNGEACTVYSTAAQIVLNEIYPGSITEGVGQNICAGDTPALLSSSTDEAVTIGGAASYQWYENETGTWAAIPGATDVAYQPAALTQTTSYKRRITNVFSALECFEETQTVTVVVFNSIPGGTISDQNICSLDDLQLLTVNNGENNANYQWQIQTTNNLWENIPGANAATFDASSVVTPGNNEIRRITTRTGENCEGISNTAVISFLDFEEGSVSSNQTICFGEVPNNFISISGAQGSGTISYQWQQFNGTDWIDINGSNDEEYQPGALTENTRFRRVDATTLNSFTCSETTNEVIITVLSELTGGTTSADQTLCSDQIPTTISVSDGTPQGQGISFQWQAKTNDAFVNIVGETDENLVLTDTPSTTTTYRRQVFNTANSTFCTVYSTESTLFVNTLVPGILVENQALCAGETALTLFAIAPAQAAGNLSYQWESSTDAGGTWSSIAGATLATYSPNTTTQNTVFRRLDTSTLNGVVCASYTNETVITFSDELIGGTTNTAQTLCQDEVPNPLTVSGGTPEGTGITFQWYESEDDVNYSPIAGETSASLNFDSGILNSTYYRREIISNANSTVCSAFSSPVLITLIQLNTGAIDGGQTICDGINVPTLTSSADASSNGVILYTWQQSEDLEVWVDLPNTDQTTYTPPPIEERITYFRRKASATLQSVSCESFTEPVVLFVNRFENADTHEIQFSDGSTGMASICNLADPPPFRTNFSLLATGSLSYQWQSSSDNINFGDIVGETNAVFDPPPVTVDIFYRRITTSELNGLNCMVTSNTLHLANGGDATGGAIGTTNPNGTNGNLEEVICPGDIPSEIIEITPSTGQNLTYQWFANNIALTGETGTGLTPTAPITQTTDFVRVTYSTNISGFACEVESNRITILVPQADNIGANFAICTNTLPGTLGDENLIEGIDYLSFQWYDSDDGVTFTPISGATSATFTPNLALTNDRYYRRGYITTIDAVVCGPEELSNTLQVFINDIDGGNISGNQNVCFEGNPSLLENTISGSARGVLSYEWHSSEDNLNWTIIDGADLETFEPEPSRRVTTYFRRTSISEFMGINCSAESNVLTVAVAEEILPGTLNSEQTVCEGEVPEVLTVTGGSSFVDQTTTWFSSTDGVIWTEVATNSDSYTPPALFETTFFKRSISRPSFIDLTCTVETNVITVFVNKVTSGNIAGNETVCFGTQPQTLSDIESATGSGALTFQWYASTDNQTYTEITGANAANYLPPNNVPSSTYFKRRVTSTLNGVPCEAETAPVLLTVVPYPIIDSASIIANDVTNVSCFEGDTGQIIIPNERITGGNNVQVQINTITLFGNPQLGSTYTIIVDGIAYGHEVVLNSSNQVQTNEEIADALANVVNSATGNDLSSVIAVANVNEIILTAKVPGTAFTAFVSTDSTNSSGASSVVTQENQAGHWYEWSKVGDTQFTANTLSISNLTAGIYYLTVFNGQCGVTSDALVVSEPEDLILQIEDSCNTALTATVSGGVSPYTFTLTRPDGSSLVNTTNSPTMTFTDLDGSATYTISVVDAVCPIPVSENVDLPNGLQFDSSTVIANNVSCFGSNNGSVSLNNGVTTVTGGFPPYNFVWTGPNNETYTTQNIENLSPGVYQLLVTDQVGCSANFTTNIASKAPLEIMNVMVVNEQLRCAGDSDAEIGFQIQADPSAQLQINWFKNGTSFTTNATYQNNLGAGQYEIEVVDLSGGSENLCSVSQLVEITAPEVFSATEISINPTSCFNPNAQRSFTFSVSGGIAPYQYQVDGGIPVIFETLQQTISGLDNTNHTITVTDANSCVVEVFSVQALTPISYSGIRTFTLEPCNLNLDFSLDTNLVSGGNPFSDTAGLPYYLYDWVGPDNFVAQDITSFTATTGSYFLTITDANSCESELIEFYIGATYPSIEVEKTISPVSCGNLDDGSIQIDVSGGLRPYSVLWEMEVPGDAENPNPVFVQLAENQFVLNDLAATRLRLTVTSDIPVCDNEDPSYFYQEIIRIPNQESLRLVAGPTLDSGLCAGNPGTITMEVFDANNGNLSFYYAGNLVPSTEIDNNIYAIQIANPQSSATLNVINDEGCGLSALVSTEVIDPSFNYTSEEFQLTQSLLVNQDIRFNNTSVEGYARAVWDFGDGSPLLEVNPIEDGTLSIHQYQFPGVFEVTLTVYNQQGCSKQITQSIQVGTGYDVMMPNVFSPNGDGINDYFQGEMTGVASFTFRIYDMWGGLVYETAHDIDNLPAIWGWDGLYRDGKIYESLSFRYLFIGRTGSNQEFTRTGEATIIRQ